jgi:protein-L-isoaspartate(D-aspartate) O-methyltransferase
MGDEAVGRMQFLLSLRKRGIMDAAVLRALDEVPREHFVEGDLLDVAYATGRCRSPAATISQPYVVAYMTEKLDVKPQHRVLVGTDRYRPPCSRLARGWSRSSATARLQRRADATRTLGYRNVEVVPATGLRRYRRQALRAHHHYRCRRDGARRSSMRSRRG